MNTSPSLFVFTLGREWKLSLAELFSVFGKEAYKSHTEEVAIFEIHGYSHEQMRKKFLTLGGSIRIIAIQKRTDEKRFATDVIECISSSDKSGKISFALGSYGEEYRLSDIGLRIKKTLGEKGISTRLINIENKNINAAGFKKERLQKTGMEWNLITFSETEKYIGYTLACQDIDAYAQRDIGKSRDMVVGMMPPKLVQMMINISTTPKNSAIYDPFCGLGTTLIEAANMGYTSLFGSDISKEMVQSSQKSLESFIENERIWQERIKKVGGTPNKDFSNFQSKISELDARKISEAPKKLGILSPVSIISEGYLGEIMNPRDITLEKVQSERRNLSLIYDDFFRGLSKTNFCNTIVMSFPFWNIHGTYSYFSEIYDIIQKNGFMTVSLLPGEMGLNTRQGSLLYKRENQTVGREIIKIEKRK